jgi:hypothetical protein
MKSNEFFLFVSIIQCLTVKEILVPKLCILTGSNDRIKLHYEPLVNIDSMLDSVTSSFLGTGLPLIYSLTL